jgi:hypothetical protein
MVALHWHSRKCRSDVARHSQIARLRIAASGIALACALIASAAVAQEAEDPLLRGAIPPEIPALSDPSLLPGSASEPDSETPPDPGAAPPAERPPATSRRDEEEEEALLRRRRQGGAAAAIDSRAAATANDSASRRQQSQRRKGSAINTLADRKDKSTRAETVRGAKRLEKTPNTAINAQDDRVVPPGLTVTPSETRGEEDENGRRRRPAADINPYDPVGIRSGALTIFPFASEEIGYESNPFRRSQQVKGSLFARTALGLRLEGDYGDARLTGSVDGDYNAYFNASEANAFSARADLGYEKDIGADTTLESALRLSSITEIDSSVGATSVSTERSLTIRGGATLGATQRFGRTSMRLRGTIDREQRGDIAVSNGTSISQEDRNRTELGLNLRLGHEVSPGYEPFVEIRVDRRIFDQRIDNSGFVRGSTGLDARAGFAFDVDEAITGELSAGYGLRLYEDSRLSTLGGFLVAGELTFEATPLTRFTIGAETSIDDTNTANSSGDFVQSARIEIEHDLLRNLQLRAALALTRSNPDVGGTEWTLDTGIGMQYRVAPELALTAQYDYTRVFAPVSADAYDAHVLLFGVRVQR